MEKKSCGERAKRNYCCQFFNFLFKILTFYYLIISFIFTGGIWLSAMETISWELITPHVVIDGIEQSFRTFGIVGLIVLTVYSAIYFLVVQSMFIRVFWSDYNDDSNVIFKRLVADIFHYRVVRSIAYAQLHVNESMYSSHSEDNSGDFNVEKLDEDEVAPILGGNIKYHVIFAFIGFMILPFVLSIIFYEGVINFFTVFLLTGIGISFLFLNMLVLISILYDYYLKFKVFSQFSTKTEEIKDEMGISGNAMSFLFFVGGVSGILGSIFTFYLGFEETGFALLGIGIVWLISGVLTIVLKKLSKALIIFIVIERLLFSVVTGVSIFMFVKGGIFFWFLVLITSQLGSIGKKIQTKTSISVIFALVGFAFILGLLSGLEQESNKPLIFSVSDTDLLPSENPYDICGHSWHGLSILDYGVFAKLAYVSKNVTSDLNFWFPENEFVIRHSETTNSHFYEFYSENKDLSVIAIRGTAVTQDVIQDFDIWIESGIVQLISSLVPIIRWSSVSESLLPTLVYLLSLPEQVALTNDRFYWEAIINYTSQLNSSNIVITGHSLGGGISKIVGSSLPQVRTAFAYSGPGITLLRGKLIGVTMRDIDETVVNIVPRHDIIPRGDVQGGLIQNIECNSSFLNCHSLLRTLCHLVDSCGSPSRITFEACKDMD